MKENKFPSSILYPPTLPISVECYGHLSTFYFIPWKVYTKIEELEEVIFIKKLIFLDFIPLGCVEKWISYTTN